MQHYCANNNNLSIYIKVKMGKIIKSGFRIVTIFVPKTILAKAATELAVWAVESLVKNSKTKVDDKALNTVKRAIGKAKAKK